jgi:hypothetical protein
MTSEVNGLRATMVTAPPVLATRIADIPEAAGPGYAPAHDLTRGLATVWPEFSEAAK